MPSILNSKQVAFDAAVKAHKDALYRGIADLEELRERDAALGPLIDQLIEIREAFNAALAVEGQNIIGDAPHAPLYLDYIDSLTSNGLAFNDADHSFIGITVPLVFDALSISRQIAQSDTVVSGIGLPRGNDREILRGVLFWILFGFVVSHEYAHHTHGHWIAIKDDRPVFGKLRRQGREGDADGWAAYLTLNHWVLAGGRKVILELLNLESAPTSVQDDVAFACFVVAQAAFTFLREPKPIDKDTVYWDTHPPQPVRLRLMSRFVLKFSGEFRPGVRETLTQPRYQSLMDAVSRLMWMNGKHAALWREQSDFLGTADGLAYYDALIVELDAFRTTLRQWEAEARAAVASSA
jgi:hypothetical protein